LAVLPQTFPDLGFRRRPILPKDVRQPVPGHDTRIDGVKQRASRRRIR
jgi:hypothetical protein